MKKTFLLFLLTISVVICSAESWQKIESEHFKIVYKQADREYAEELYSICEDVYDTVCAVFDHYPKKVNVLITSTDDTSNGYSLAFMDYIVLQTASPAPIYFGPSTDNTIKRIFIHEFTHHIDMTCGGGILQTLMSLSFKNPSGLFTAFAPYWLTEGIATNLETMLTTSGRGRGPLFELQYKGPILESSLFSVDQSNYTAFESPSGRSYIYGYILIDYILTEYGLETYVNIRKELNKNPLAGINNAVVKYTGKTIDILSKEMRSALLVKYKDMLSLPSGKRFDSNRHGNYFLIGISGDELIAYRDDSGETSAFIAYNIYTGEERVIRKMFASGSQPGYFSLSKNGKTIASTVFRFSMFDGIRDVIHTDIILIDTASGNTEQISKNKRLRDPVVFNNRVFAVQVTGNTSRIIELHKENNSVTVLYQQEDANVFDPAVSPDGKILAFELMVNSRQGIVLIDTSAEQKSEEFTEPWNTEAVSWLIPEKTAGQYCPYFLDNNLITFSAYGSHGSLSLFQSRIDSGSAEELLSDKIGAFQGFFTSDYVFYSSYGSDGFCIRQQKIPDIILEPYSGPEIIITEKKRIPVPKGKKTGIFAEPAVVLFYPFMELNADNSAAFLVNVFSQGYSLNRSSDWQLWGGFNFTTLHPSWDFVLNAYSKAGRFSFYSRYNFISLSSSFVQQTAQTIRFVPDLNIQAPESEYNSFLDISPYTSYLYTKQEADLFTIAESDFSTGFHNILIGLNIGYQIRERGPFSDIFSRPGFIFKAAANYALPINTGAFEGLHAQTAIKGIFPSFIKNQSIQLGVKIDYSTGSNSSGSITSRSETVNYNRPNEVLAALEIQTMLAHTDIPIIQNIGLIGISNKTFAEVYSTYELQPGFNIDYLFYLGTEFTFIFSTPLESFFPITIGVIVPFADINKLTPYISLNSDTFF